MSCIKYILLMFLFSVWLVSSAVGKIWLPDESGIGNISVIKDNGIASENPAFILKNRFITGISGNYFSAGVDFGNINNINFIGGTKLNNYSKIGMLFNYLSFDALGDNVKNIESLFMYNYNMRKIILGIGADIQYESYKIDNENSSIIKIGGSLGIIYKMFENFKISGTLNDIDSKDYDVLIDKFTAGCIYNISNLSLLGEIGSFQNKVTGKAGFELKYLMNRFKVRTGINFGGSDIFRINGIGAGFSYKFYNFEIVYSAYYIFNLGNYGTHSIGIQFFGDGV